MRKLFFTSGFMLMVCAAGLAQNVNYKNGNFYVYYVDIEFDSTILVLERGYNSKSTDKGWFGMGWGGPLETYLHPIPGGGVAVYHWGGSLEVFLPKEPDQQALSADINKMINIAQRKKEVTTPDQIFQLRQRLEEDQYERINEWKKYLDEGLVESQPAAGERFESFSNANSFVVFTGEEFELTDEDTKRVFDNNGRLIRSFEPGKAEAQLFYEKGRLPVTVKDALGNQLDLTYNSDGRLERAVGTYPDGTRDSSFYTYDDETGALTSSLDAGKNFYRYEWDNSFNMVKILYTDGTSTDIEYDEHFFASKVKKKNGSFSVYEYPRISDTEYGNMHMLYDSTGKLVKTLGNWYVIKQNELGASWTHKWTIIQDEDSTTYINNEKYGIADTVYQNGGNFYAYQYDNKGNLTGISYSSGLKVKVERNGERLAKIITPKNTYTAVYKDDKIEKLQASSGDSVPMPLTGPFTDKKGLRDELIRVIPAFMATSYWWDLGINDDMLKAAKKVNKKQ